MTATASTFDGLLQGFETALLEYERLGEVPAQVPEYSPEGEMMTLASVERYKEAQARYEQVATAHAQAEQQLTEAKQALDAWFPASVMAAFAQGVALVAPAPAGVIVVIRHNDSYLIERGATQQEALTKLERFLNQF